MSPLKVLFVVACAVAVAMCDEDKERPKKQVVLGGHYDNFAYPSAYSYPYNTGSYGSYYRSNYAYGSNYAYPYSYGSNYGYPSYMSRSIYQPSAFRSNYAYQPMNYYNNFATRSYGAYPYSYGSNYGYGAYPYSTYGHALAY